jgi:NDP-sugar pyrophosphorylase family protein
MMLTAGVGERMLPLTLGMPKAALPVLGRPLVVQTLNRLGRAGVEQAVLNLHHHPDVLRDLLERNGVCVDTPVIRFSHEETIQGTGGGLRKAAPMLRDDGPIIVINGDFLADIDLPAALAHHHASGLPATLVLASARPGYSVIEVDTEGRVLSLGGEPAADTGRVAGRHLFTGCHVIDEALLDRLPADRPSCVVRDLYRPLAAEGKLGSWFHDGFWWEFGSPELYLEGSLRLLELPAEQLGRIAEHDPLYYVDRAVVAVGAGARVRPGSQVIGRAAVGFAAQVGEESALQDSVVMPEAWVGPGCRLRRAVVGPGAELPRGFELSDGLVCTDPIPDAEPPPPTRRVEGLLVYDFVRRAD